MSFLHKFESLIILILNLTDRTELYILNYGHGKFLGTKWHIDSYTCFHIDIWCPKLGTSLSNVTAFGLCKAIYELFRAWKAINSLKFEIVQLTLGGWAIQDWTLKQRMLVLSRLWFNRDIPLSLSVYATAYYMLIYDKKLVNHMQLYLFCVIIK